MHHVAIMKKEWGLIEKILSGEKTVESRWYKTKKSPWDKVKAGDIIYFKNTGGPVLVKATVSKVLQTEILNEKTRQEILDKYAQKDLGVKDIMPAIRSYIKDKNYCLLVFLENPKKIEPFEINKKGFGAMAAWITVDNINQIKIKVINS